MDLQEVLKPGKQIELTAHDEEGNAYKLKTLIESGYDGESFGIISPMYEGNYFPLHTNDKLQITFEVVQDKGSKKKEAYSMSTMVLERRKVEKQSVVILTKTSTPKKIQRRQTFRLHILKNITYTYNGKKKEILLKNISATGLRGIVEERLPHDSEVMISLDLENENETMSIKCRVIACDQVTNSMIQHDLRLQFLDLTDAQKNKITNYIFRKQSESIRKTLDAEGRSSFSDMIYDYESNRRHGNDFIMRTVPLLGLITWFMSLSVVALIVESRPEARYNLDQYFNFYKRGYWRADLLTIAFLIAFLELILCTTGLYMNSKRLKRVGDQYNRGLIINIVFSILVIFLYIILPIGQ